MRADQLTLFVEDSHVKTSALQENDVDLRESAVDFGSSLRASLMRLNPSGSSLKTCQVYSLAMEDETLPSSFSGWQSAGMAWGGECLTVKALDLPSDANVCLLSQVLEHHVDARYFLSPKACAGIIRRAEARGKVIPEPLRSALVLTSAMHSEQIQAQVATKETEE